MQQKVTAADFDRMERYLWGTYARRVCEVGLSGLGGFIVDLYCIL